MWSWVDVGGQLGTKRPRSDEELEGEQRLAKRLHKLQLNPHGPSQTTSHVADDSSKHASGDHMYLDDTKHKVYIHDLDAELAEIPDEGPKIEFLPEIEKRLAAFPSLLENRKLSPTTEGQLILYKPISLSEEVKEERRKAIIEERRKAKEAEVQQQGGIITAPITIDVDRIQPVKGEKTLGDVIDDADAMDIG